MHCQKAILLFISLLPALASASPESAQLAQTLKQLDGIQVTLERARQHRSPVALLLRLSAGAAGYPDHQARN